MRKLAVLVAAGMTLATGSGTLAHSEAAGPTATVRYVATTIAGYNAGMGVGEIAASLVTPTSLDGYIQLRALRPEVSLVFDDLGAPDGAAIPVSVYGLGRSWSGARGCVPVRQAWRISGFAVGTVLRIRVQGATDVYHLPAAGDCTGHAAGGTLTAVGAVFQPYGPGAAATAYPASSGCSVSTHMLLPRETETCTFTATAPGGWRLSYEGPGVIAGDYITDVTVTVTRDRREPPYGTTETRFVDSCRTGVIQVGDRVTVTIRQYDSGYSQHTLDVGQGEGC